MYKRKIPDSYANARQDMMAMVLLLFLVAQAVLKSIQNANVISRPKSVMKSLELAVVNLATLKLIQVVPLTSVSVLTMSRIPLSNGAVIR